MCRLHVPQCFVPILNNFLDLEDMVNQGLRLRSPLMRLEAPFSSPVLSILSLLVQGICLYFFLWLLDGGFNMSRIERDIGILFMFIDLAMF